MENRGIPEGWSGGQASRIGVDPTAPLPADLGSLPQAGGVHQEQIPQGRVAPPVTPKQKRQGWLKNWMFWAALAGLISGGAGLISVAMLLKLPAAPNCPSIFWPMASASVRLHCAQVAANKQTVNDLLQAIALVQALPKDHPWRPEINRFLEQWSLDILDIGDEAFQAGKLQEAIAIARKVPQDVPAYQLVEKRIDGWQSMWSQAEAIYKEAEAELREQHWHQAFMAAVRLLNVDNNYWTTTKYEELNNRIETTREDSNKLAKAQRLAQTGSLDNLLEATKLADSIGSNSYIYQDVKDALVGFGRKLLDMAQEMLDKRDFQEAIAIANQIPASTSLQSEAQDFVTIAEAWQSAGSGTVPSLEAAIATAQKLGSDRPLYNKAQELITRWQLEMEDIAHLERARGLAQQGTVGDLTAAIKEAELIRDTNPRASEAQQEINRWRQRVETIEDSPYLDRAENLAVGENVNSLSAAIDEASHIASGRALYREAQSKIRTWTQKIQLIEDQPYLNRAEEIAQLEDVNSLSSAINEASQIGRGRVLYREAQRKIWTWTQKIQRIQDQPYLDQARLLASSGNIVAAIAAAQRIQPGRALSSEAQAAINDWQGQIRARQNWLEARQLALQGTPDALVQAIRLADRVPTTSPLRSDANVAIAQWSQQMLSIARSRGEYDIPGGIAIAKQIPRGTDAYRVARRQIAIWQKFLNPEPPPTPEQSNTSEQQ